MKRWLLLDISNVLYRTFFAHKQEDDITVAGLATHAALVTINSYFRKFKPDKIVMAFDRPSWRKDYTATEECVSKRAYKGHRRQKMTPSEKVRYQMFQKHLAEFEHLIRNHSSIIALAGDALEADDVVAGFVQIYSMDEDNEIIILSGDGDMIQLLAYPNVRVVDPASGKDRTLADWGGDAGLFLFEKCLRGDIGDNVMSAYPRIRKTRINKAYTDKFERQNMFKETWTSPDGTEFVVEQLFKENELLMDLQKQPEYIQKHIVKTILKCVNECSHFSYFHFMQFLGKYELNKIADQAEQFVGMLSK